ncbi:cytochrome P450 [Streptomyces sp. MI02-7b]|uniref:cytochrome P450 n=1 Tax=Streptomyces sp. MI02-7b TaxID=462941 RepID=UPI0029BF0763|nr:cytochrome P450 [Streptomyces sp. MI02-7b]MDX3073623.1 cytochrome P450 [Streptomyces sp. MI02-7b]
MTTPPPECPAHAAGFGAGGARRLYGAEAEADPMGVYEKLRAEHGAIAPVLVHGDLPAWLVLGYRENLEVLRTPSRFSSDSRRWHAFQEGKVPPEHPIAPTVMWQPLVNFNDGDAQKRLRGAVSRGLSRFNRHGIRRHVTRVTHQLADEFCAKGRADLVGQFAELLPVLVLTNLLGLPEQDGPRLAEACRDLMKGTETSLASYGYILEALTKLVAEKHASPGYDLASWLIEDEAGLSDDEVVQHLRLVLVAANETTANLISDMIKLVLTDPRFRGNLSGGHMTLPDGLEQVLWDQPPLWVMPGRYATGPMELGGQHIEEGDMLLLGLAAGNTDPAIRPDLAASMHGNRSHLAFGGGPHECPGQDIGRAIAETGIDVLLGRLPDLNLAVEEDALVRVPSWTSRHLLELPVEFTPRRPQRDEDAEGAAAASRPVAEPEAVPRPAPSPVPQQTLPPQPAFPPRAPRRSWWRVLTGWLRR